MGNFLGTASLKKIHCPFLHCQAKVVSYNDCTKLTRHPDCDRDEEQARERNDRWRITSVIRLSNGKSPFCFLLPAQPRYSDTLSGVWVLFHLSPVSGISSISWLTSKQQQQRHTFHMSSGSWVLHLDGQCLLTLRMLNQTSSSKQHYTNFSEMFKAIQHHGVLYLTAFSKK